MRSEWGVIALVLTLSGCGGSSDAEDTDTTTTTTSGNEQAESALASAENWEGMSHGDQMGWMDTEVVPHMQARFQEFDGERYAEFGCGTCHGENASERNYEMPNNSLPALHATGTPEQQAMVAQYRPMVMFMFQQVLPDMQTLVGEEEYDEETEAGFSCYSCHPHAGDEGSTPISLEPVAEGEGDAAEEPDAG